MISIDGNSLTLDEVVRVARQRETVEISPAGRQQLAASRAIVDKLLDSAKPVYGISTGFGNLSQIWISPEEREALQRNLILSHAAGVGDYLPEDVVRTAMLMRANSLVKGYSGIRPVTVEMLLELLNRGVYPAVPSKGSVGASGDLSPLSHIALVLMGEGKAFVAGKLVTGAEALAAVGLFPVAFAAKEGLALINGTQIMTAVGALVVHDAALLMKAADIAAAAANPAAQRSERMRRGPTLPSRLPALLQETAAFSRGDVCRSGGSRECALERARAHSLLPRSRRRPQPGGPAHARGVAVPCRQQAGGDGVGEHVRRP